MLAVDEAGEHAEIAGEALGVRFEQERRDLWALALAIAVDAAIALLDANQRPRNVEVNEVVALRVQVHALGGDIARDEDANWRTFEFEGLDHCLLLDIAQTAVQNRDLIGFEFETRHEVLAHPMQSGYTFSENNGAFGATAADANLFEAVYERREFCGVTGEGGGVEILQAKESLAFCFCVVR